MGRRGIAQDTSRKKKKTDKVNEAVKIREELSRYERVYVIKFNMAGTKYQSRMRMEFRDAIRLCMSSHSVLSHAIGFAEEDSARPELFKLRECLSEHTGLLMTTAVPHETIMSYVNGLTGEEYATCGFIATQTFTVQAGPLPQFSFSMEAYLRELGLPVRLDNGVVMCLQDHVVCTEGRPLTKNSARLLVQFEVKMASFSARIVAGWHNGAVTQFHE